MASGPKKRLVQGYFLAIFSKLKRRKTKTQAKFWPKLKHFFSKTQGNITKLKFSESLKSINSHRANFHLIQTDNQSARVQSSRQYLNNISKVGQKLKLFAETQELFSKNSRNFVQNSIFRKLKDLLLPEKQPKNNPAVVLSTEHMLFPTELSTVLPGQKFEV